MKQISRIFILSTFLILFLFIDNASATQVFIGTSKVSLSPPGTTPRHLRHQSTDHDSNPLYARTLVLSRGQEIVVLMAADLVLIDQELRADVLERTQLNEDQLILSATHTHSGASNPGDRYWEGFVTGNRHEPLHQFIVNQLALSVKQASAQRVPITAEFGEISIADLIRNRMVPTHQAEHKLKVLRFLNQRRVVASMIFMAAHGTAFPNEGFLFSADYPGIVTDYFERKDSGSVSLFFNGAAADLEPRIYETPDAKAMVNYGKQIAIRAESILFRPAFVEGPWESITETVKLPKVGAKKWILAGSRFFPKKTVFQTLRLGEFAFTAFPGDLASEIGDGIERRTKARGLTPLMVGYANDYIGYVIDRRYHHSPKPPQARVSFYGEKMAWWVQEIFDRAIDDLLLESEIPNLYPRGSLSLYGTIPVLHLKGTPFHRGYEEGRIMREEIRTGVSKILKYLRKKMIVPVAGRMITNQLLDSAWRKMEPYVSYDEYQQLKGLARSSGVSLKNLKRIHALPEVYPTWCSGGAYWGPATKTGDLIAIRNLDWNREIGVQNMTALKIHQMEGQQDYINIGYYGFTGVLSGINNEGISVGQIGASSKDETLKGVPMPFLLKRILTQSNSLVDAMYLLEQSKRTRGYHYILSDAKAKEAIVVETTKSHLAYFQAKDPKEANQPYAFRVRNAVFRGDPALNPEIRDKQTASGGKPRKKGLEFPEGDAYEIRYKKHGELLKRNFGRIDVEVAKDIAWKIAPPTNIQSVIYAFPDFYVANAKGDLRAAGSPYLRFNLDQLMRE